MSKKKKFSKTTLIIISLIVLSILLLVFYFINDTYDYSKKLLDSSKDFVYTYKDYSTTKFTKQVPHLNLSIVDINEKIDNFVSSYVNQDNIITYKYSISNNVLSLVIRIISFTSEKAPLNYFKSFNINLDTLQEVDNAEVLNAYNITSEDVQAKIEKQFKDYYYDLVFQEKINETACNIECFIQRRGFLGYMQDVYYYIDNGKLIAYKPFLINTSTWEYEYFKDCDFSFKIVG